MYFINKKIVKTIANEIYRDADFEENDNWYVIYDSENKFKDFDLTVVFSVNKEMPNEAYEFKHFIITVQEDKSPWSNFIYYTTNTLNRRELADTLLDIISRYEYLKKIA